MELKNEQLKSLLEKRQEAVDAGKPLFDKIEETVSKVIKNNMSRIATDNDMWKYLKPYIDEKEYKDTNVALASIYRKLQKLEYKMNRLKERAIKEVEKEGIKLKEFEEIGSVTLKDGKVEVNIIDKVEEYKKMLREKSEK